ncbi:MAG: hypothetical protein ABI091_26920 [Ferruginibacter sp.]
MKYGIFFTGLCSTPYTIGLINWTTGEKIHEIEIKGETGKSIRANFEKKRDLLNKKYKLLIS